MLPVLINYDVIKSLMVYGFTIYFGIVTCNDNTISDKIPSFVETFQIYSPIIENTLLNQFTMINVVKSLSLHGHEISFDKKKAHHYQSYLIFTQIENFKWTFRTDGPVLVVCNIQNKNDLIKVNVSISEELFFMDWKSQKVYEAYQINNIQTIKYLGQFQDPTKVKYEKLIQTNFVRSEYFITPMMKRRSNFHGLKLNAITETSTTKLLQLNNTKKYIKNSKIYYDVDNLQNDPHMFYFPIAIPILRILQRTLNFTTHLFIEDGQKVGSPQMLQNQTIHIGDGMFQNLIEGSADIILSRMSILPIREQFVDFLTPLDFDHIAIYITVKGIDEAIDWTAYFDPFSVYAWMTIFFECLLFPISVYVIEKFHGYKLVSIYDSYVLILLNLLHNKFSLKIDICLYDYQYLDSSHIKIWGKTT